MHRKLQMGALCKFFFRGDASNFENYGNWMIREEKEFCCIQFVVNESSWDFHLLLSIFMRTQSTKVNFEHNRNTKTPDIRGVKI